MTQQTTSAVFTELTDDQQSAVVGGGGQEAAYAVGYALSVAGFFITQIAILGDHMQSGVAPGYASGYGFF